MQKSYLVHIDELINHESLKYRRKFVIGHPFSQLTHVPVDDLIDH